jgi:hypothetical protein
MAPRKSLTHVRSVFGVRPWASTELGMLPDTAKAPDLQVLASNLQDKRM